jgi:hypothetical protein
VRFAAATGTRPSEWIALERRDIDRENGIAIVQRSYSRGTLRPYGKTQRSRRSVPLSRMALDALAAVPPRIDSPLAFPSPSGGLIDLHNWRAREWKPALEAAGIGHGTIYTLRHTFATNAIAAGMACSNSRGTWARASRCSTGSTTISWPAPNRPHAPSSTLLPDVLASNWRQHGADRSSRFACAAWLSQADDRARTGDPQLGNLSARFARTLRVCRISAS